MTRLVTRILLGTIGALATTFVARADNAKPPTDPQIAQIVVTANSVDIEAAQLAKTKTKSADVGTFADLMITDHGAVNTSATQLVTKLGVKPEENDASRGLKAGGDKNLARLKTLSGAAFDKAYVDNEVTYHQAVLDTIDKVLIPNAKNEELKALIVKVRPAIAAHLEHARHMQTALKK